ncbi:MAG: protease inhibitor I42 family protein [Terracidiphilus sp.]
MQSRWLADGQEASRWLTLVFMLGLVFFPRPSLAATKVITDADKGAVVHLKSGQEIEVRLKANPSTGYLWYVQRDSTASLKLVRQSQTEPEEPGVGRPVFQVFRFRAARTGQGPLRLHYVRSWEKPTADEERFEVHVVVE